MSLAGVIVNYKAEMICDLAETYQIFDYRRVPGRLLGTLVAGLGANSRVMKKAAGIDAELPDIVILAKILDDLEIMKWWKTEDGHKGRNAPDLITPLLFGTEDKEDPDDFVLFMSGADFDAARDRLLKGMQ